MQSTVSKRAVNRERWQERIAVWKASGLSQRVFCDQHHLVLSTFRRWHRRLHSEQTKSERSGLMKFVPVTLKSDNTPKLAVLINDDLRVEVPSDFEADRRPMPSSGWIEFQIEN